MEMGLGTGCPYDELGLQVPATVAWRYVRLLCQESSEGRGGVRCMGDFW